jgi:hypothetical protein
MYHISILDYLVLLSFVFYQNIKCLENNILFYKTVYRNSSVRFSKRIIT